MASKEVSDYELTNEAFRRMYDPDSEIIAVKIWTREDIKLVDSSLKDEELKKVEMYIDKDLLTDCQDGEWQQIKYAIDEYKACQEKKECLKENRI